MADNIYDEFKINEIDVDFVERMLKSLPSNIYFKDMEGKYVFCTHYWNHINQGGDEDLDWSIRGKTDLEIRKDKENAKKAMEQDQKIFATKKGTSYEICEQMDGKTEYLQLIKNPVFDAKGNMIGIVGLINNITEMKELEKKLERMATVDLLTQLRNRAYLPMWIDKNRNEDIYPLSVIVGDCNRLKRVNDKLGHLAGDAYIKETANAFRKHMINDGCVFRIGGDEFLILLPKCDRAHAAEYAANVRKTLSDSVVFGIPVSVSIGVAECNDREFRIEDYIRMADEEMYADKMYLHTND